jgi:hypothetical protein
MPQHVDLIRSVAHLHGIDPILVQAVVQKESSYNTWAWNPEPHYRYLWDVRKNRAFRTLTPLERTNETPPTDFPILAGDRDQEWWGQQASWGLMQVMGAVAREHGLRAPYVTVLCDPQTGLEYGCKHLAKLLKRAQGDEQRALSAYNAGWAPSAQGSIYAAGVLKIRQSLVE